MTAFVGGKNKATAGPSTSVAKATFAQDDSICGRKEQNNRRSFDFGRQGNLRSGWQHLWEERTKATAGPSTPVAAATFAQDDSFGGRM
jgi:hypothetical protein